MTPVQGNAFLSETPTTLYALRKIKRGFRRLGVIDPFPSVDKYLSERNANTAHINEENFFVGYMVLEKKQAGWQKRQIDKRPVVQGKDVWKHLCEIVEEEMDELMFATDEEELIIVLLGDLDNFLGDVRNQIHQMWTLLLFYSY